MTDTTRELLATIAEQVRGLNTKLDETRSDMRGYQDKSDKSRAVVHKRLDDMNEEMHDFRLTSSTQASAFEALKKSVADVQAVTDDVKNMRQQAQGAGSLGQALLRLGGWVLATAGWAVGVYTYWTGRPPP